MFLIQTTEGITLSTTLSDSRYEPPSLQGTLSKILLFLQGMLNAECQREAA